MNRKRIAFRLPLWTAPVALLGLSLVGYIPLIYRLGFYWDDWPSMWFYHLWGPFSFLESFSIDRPTLAWVYMLTTTIFKESTVGWQLFGVAARWAAGMALWWTLCGIWPRRATQAFWAAALFVIYPGFSQQYISVTYSNAFLVYTLFLISLGAMVWAQRKPAWFWPLTALSLITQVVSMSMTEYFYGLELLRPAFLWLVMEREGEPKKAQLRRVAVGWLPYLVPAGVFLIDRMFFHQTPRGQILLFEQFTASPFWTLLRLGFTILIDFFEVNFAAWFAGLNPAFLGEFEANILRMFFAIMIGGALFSIWYLSGLKSSPAQDPAGEDEPDERAAIQRWGKQAAGLGIYAFLVSGWIIWVTNLHIELIFPWDRFTLITMVGTSLLIAGLVALVTRTQLQSAIVLGVLIGFSAGLQFQHRLYYRQEWLAQRNFLWQLIWRAPGIEPGTTLLTSELPFKYFSDNSLTAPINWAYAPENRTREMAYLLYDLEARLGLNGFNAQSGVPVSNEYRAARFEGSTDQAIVVFYDPPRCVKVVDPAVDRFLPVKPLYIREATPLSKPELIVTNPSRQAAPPEHIFGPEPPHNWCYYFEKAELYGQMGEWKKAAEAADKALKITKHFTDKNVSELLPFVEAYAHTGDWEKAVNYSLQAYQIWDKTQYPLCDVWLRILATTEPSEERQAAVEKIQKNLSCKIP